jgi:hypothetical protein
VHPSRTSAAIDSSTDAAIGDAFKTWSAGRVAEASISQQKKGPNSLLNPALKIAYV